MKIVLLYLCALAHAEPIASPPPVASPPPPPVASPPPPVASPPGHKMPSPPEAAEPAEPEISELELRSASETVTLGEVAVFEIVNTSARAFRFHHPGGSNGCAAFRWSMQLIAADGTTYADDWSGPGKACTAVMIPPREIVIAPGEVVSVEIDTGHALFLCDGGGAAACVGQEPQRAMLQPARYAVEITGAGQRLQATLVVGG